MKINNYDYFLMGIFLVSLAFYFFGSILFTSKSALIEREGRIEEVKIYYNWVKSSRGARSIKCELALSFIDDECYYSIFDNVGRNTFYAKFEEIKRRLKPNRTATIWIRKYEKSSNHPTVFQIANDKNEILYAISDAKSLSKFGFIASCSLGFIFILLSFRKRT